MCQHTKRVFNNSTGTTQLIVEDTLQPGHKPLWVRLHQPLPHREGVIRHKRKMNWLIVTWQRGWIWEAGISFVNRLTQVTISEYTSVRTSET